MVFEKNYEHCKIILQDSFKIVHINAFYLKAFRRIAINF